MSADAASIPTKDWRRRLADTTGTWVRIGYEPEPSWADKATTVRIRYDDPEPQQPVVVVPVRVVRPPFRMPAMTMIERTGA
jgi:hypothetical protein